MPAIPKPGEIWKNNKTGHKYKVLLITQDSEDLKPRVVYAKSDYECPWDRPLELFFSKFTKEQ